MNGNKVTQRSEASHCKTKRFFTLDQANSALPLVRRIASDIVAQYQQLEHLQRKRERLSKQDKSKQDKTDERRGLDSLAVQGSQRLKDLIDEIKLIGCEPKDWVNGLIDFPALLDGREVYLCWRLGEEQVSHWHETHAGTMGRQPVDAYFSV